MFICARANEQMPRPKGKRNDKARRSEILVKAEVTAVLTLGGLVFISLLSGTVEDTGLLVVGNTLLEEVGLAAKGDVLHEVEGVGGLVDFLVTKSDKETISDELNVLLHEVRVHAEEGTWKSLSEELLFNGDGISDDILDHLLAGTALEVRVEEAGKVSVKTLVTRDELIREGQTRHETTLLEPEYRGEGTTEEDTFNGSESNETLGKGGVLILDPSDGPVSLLSDAGNGLNGVEEVGSLGRLLDVGVNEEGVGLGVNVLHHDLEAVETTSLGDLDLATESLDEVLVDNTIRGSEESKDVRDEELLIGSQAVVPVVEILGEVNLLSSPEGSLSLLVHLPNLSRAVSMGRVERPLYASKRVTYLMVLDGKENKTLGVLLKQRLVGFLRLDARGNSDLGLLLLGLFDNLCLEVGGIEGLVQRLVLLIGGAEVELLDGRLHVEVLNGGSSL